MSQKPYLDERRLRRALEGQGFTIDPTSDGYRVLAPDGNGTANVHVHSIDASTGRSYANAIADLVRIGFDLDQVKPSKTTENGWKAEREEIEKLVASETEESREQRAAEEARKSADADIYERLQSVNDETRAVYELVKAEPGLSPRQYAEKIEDPLVDRARVSHAGSLLKAAGLIESTGATISVRYWIAGEVDLSKIPEKPKREQNGSSRRAGPVRVRQIEPSDPVVRFRRMGEKAIKLKRELEEIVVAMVEEYSRLETENVENRRKLKRLEEILGKAVDSV